MLGLSQEGAEVIDDGEQRRKLIGGGEEGFQWGFGRGVGPRALRSLRAGGARASSAEGSSRQAPHGGAIAGDERCCAPARQGHIPRN